MISSEAAKNANTNGGQPDGLSIRRVLMPVDFSVCTLETLQYAKLMAEKFDAMVDLLHVIQFNFTRQEEPRLPAGMIPALGRTARQELTKLVGLVQEGKGGTVFSIRVREGLVHEVILNEALATNARLIVMGTRDRSWLSGPFRRHPVKHVIQNSPCPVVVIRTGVTGLGASQMRAASLQ